MSRQIGLCPDSGTPSRRVTRVLIANRGEIAVRILRACRDLGLQTVVAYSEADRESMAVQMADRSVCIGPAPAADSYLNANAILAAATALNVDLIHPGYGFLAESAAFAAACEAEGIGFVGPRPGAVASMGNKVEARRIAQELGVPVIPGSPAGIGDLAAFAEGVGFPVIVKASAGGGGRGMRLVQNASDLDAVMAGASAEADAAFGDGAVYLEKYLPNARHIEIQVVFDGQGHGIHLGERDCTVQRRYQKLVEEAPSPAIDAETRAAMGEAALRLCASVNYRGVGTVEFLLDQDTGLHYFIEMNTRLQVEHPVTELVSGLDIVALQLQIALGAELPLVQGDVSLRGHAIEFRINAEDATAGFRPAAGTIDRWSIPQGPGVRVDTHCYPGYLVPPYYDSMLAKVVVWGADREQAIARARRTLAEFAIGGITTSLPFHAWIVCNEDFLTSATNTAWAEQAWAASQS